jgi:hypothetical protein
MRRACFSQYQAGVTGSHTYKPHTVLSVYWMHVSNTYVHCMWLCVTLHHAISLIGYVSSLWGVEGSNTIASPPPTTAASSLLLNGSCAQTSDYIGVSLIRLPDHLQCRRFRNRTPFELWPMSSEVTWGHWITDNFDIAMWNDRNFAIYVEIK